MGEHKNINSIKKCANCGACLNACSVDAIRIEDSGLFYEPKVNEEICIECGKCVAVCPIHNPRPGMNVISAWWGYSQDRDIVKKSSSGGLFTEFAEFILSKQGIVYAACFDNDRRTVKIQSTDEVSLDALRRSKYVESLVNDTFQEVKQQLLSDRLVLYCATPCQIAGLKSYLNKDYPNLYTCDFTCGGLPSHKLYQEYITLLEAKYGAKVTKVNFRPKIYGWSTYAIQVDFSNRRKYKMPASLDPFFYGFVGKNVNARDYCYECRFADNHVSDIILADFWKFESIIGKKKSERGTSLILVNSAKGEYLVNEIKSKTVLHPIEIEDASYNLKRRKCLDENIALRRRYLYACNDVGLVEAMKVVNKISTSKIFKTKIKCIVKGFISRFR